MQKNSKLLILISSVCIALFGIWYITLKFSAGVETSGVPTFLPASPAQNSATKPVITQTEVPESTANVEQTPSTTPTPSVIKVHVAGEVENPGVYALVEGQRVDDAILAAGGFTELGDKSSINLAAKIKDEQKIVVANINDPQPTETPLATERKNEDNPVTTVKNGKININTATLSELTTLDGIGETIGKNIITYRVQNNGFKSIEELKEVSRIGDKVFEGIKEFVTVN